MIWTILLLVVLVLTVYYVASLIFHWFKYGATLPLVWLALPIYLTGTGVLVLLMLAAYASLV